MIPNVAPVVSLVTQLEMVWIDTLAICTTVPVWKRIDLMV
jgi:hypothetical protein